MATIILLYGIQLNVCNFFYFSETEPSQNNEISKQPEVNEGAEVSQQTEVNQQTGVNQHSDKQKLEIGKRKKEKLCGEKHWVFYGAVQSCDKRGIWKVQYLSFWLNLIMTVYFLFFFFICIPSFRNKSLQELRLEKEHTFQMEQMRLENERGREEREHELKIFQLLLGNKVAQPIAVPPAAYAQQ